jgi:hypothetical protein
MTESGSGGCWNNLKCGRWGEREFGPIRAMEGEEAIQLVPSQWE